MANKSYEEVFQTIVANLKAKNSEGVDDVVRAYELAKKLHIGQTRKSGEPYIEHPVAVAAILERRDFDSDMICAGLLHDVVEDCDMTINELKKSFNPKIAEIVDSVTAIEKQNYSEDESEIFDDKNFLKPSLESKTYQKLLAIGKKNKLAFFIKFADRLHNLRTISVFDEYKQLEKVRETEKWILPLCHLMKSNDFYYKILNECFKIKNQKSMVEFNEDYRRYHRLNKKIYAQLKEEFIYQMDNYLKRNKIKAEVSKIVFEKSKEEDVFANIKKVIDVYSLKQVKQSHFNKVATSIVYVVFSGKLSQQSCSNILLDVLEDKSINNMMKIIGYEVDSEFGIGYIHVEDNIKNKYRVTAMNLYDYTIFQNGTIEGTDIENIDEDVSKEIISNFITVKTRSGQIMKIPENSTVLDFAFRIHRDVGFSARYGLINDSPNKMPLYTKLSNGDKVSIICEKDVETGLKKNISQIRWLAYVKTEYAQKSLIRYFEKKFLDKN